MRFQLLYGTIFISLFFNLGGVFLIALQSLGIEKFPSLRNRICLPDSLYRKRKRKILFVALLVLISFFFILREGYFDVLRLGVTFFFLFSGLLIFFLLFFVFFNIDRLISWISWLENHLMPGIIGISGFLFLSIGLTLQGSALLLFLAYQFK